ncbi:aminodeoxychorismate lyase [Psychromonas ingrahamii 37]|uniref:Endolytic murein transglycosylase n=1 Tax=Psychromonas ingrahamii (strain DSM 17664 / CCUG 51855 / 37) TaxID=357804 RepID=A1STW7_PSYIN|nr:endolytic transglycosylase MltG [Psychromonas ingrahamii]ABM02932.1 aminodeoxychorismate lyase [Psychromonas ingrahamii 37]
MPTKKIVLSLFFLIFLVLGSVIWGQKKLNSYLNTPLVNQPTLFTINNGSNFHHLGNNLLKTEIISDLTWWKVLGKLHPELINIKSGTYQFEKGFTLNDILMTVNKGIEHQFIITFVEGSTFKEWLPILNNAPFMKPLQETEAQILVRLNSSYEKLEGLLFPETYHYSAGMSAFQIIKKSYVNQQQILEKLWADRDKTLPFKTPYEALILASIIEKESGLSADRDKIASVFINRMRIGMRLQTDPTVIYGMGDRYDGRIRSKDLREETDYNTYRINGLPPTPIAMPSEAALYAALHPSTTKYLYFVSKGDGTSYFSKSLREHNNAVQKYILGK